jgi:hypothetical protein
MSTTRELHTAFLRPLEKYILQTSSRETKPLLVDLKFPMPPRLRVYLYSLVGGVGTTRPKEYKCVLRVPGQAVGQYGSFDHSGGRVSLLVGYRSDLDVFVLWDASLHARFKNGGNIQVRDVTVLRAAASGRAEQIRHLSTKSSELVIACQSWNLAEAVQARLSSLGGVDVATWAISQS